MRRQTASKKTTPMFKLLRPFASRAAAQPSHRPHRQNRRKPTLESLERREVATAGIAHPAAQIHAAQARTQAIHVAATQLSISQLNSRIPGKWRVQYDVSNIYGPGAFEVQEITFTGPKGAKTFVSTTALVVQGFFGPAYYQFSSWGSYRFVTNKVLRLTITGGSPTEYLNNGIIVMGGQSMPLQFINKNAFRVQGQTYQRIPLNSSLF